MPEYQMADISAKTTAARQKCWGAPVGCGLRAAAHSSAGR